MTSDKPTAIPLIRRTESLRQEAGEAALWLIENCKLVMAFGGRLLAEDNDEVNSAHWDVGKMDERTRYLTVIALKKGVSGETNGRSLQD